MVVEEAVEEEEEEAMVVEEMDAAPPAPSSPPPSPSPAVAPPPAPPPAPPVAAAPLRISTRISTRTLLRRQTSTWRWRGERFAPLTAQRYQEIRVWPALSARIVDGPRWLRRLQTLQSAILLCTLASTLLAMMSFAGGHLPVGLPLNAASNRSTLSSQHLISFSSPTQATDPIAISFSLSPLGVCFPVHVARHPLCARRPRRRSLPRFLH